MTATDDTWVLHTSPPRARIYKRTIGFRVDEDQEAFIKAYTDTFDSVAVAFRALISHPQVAELMRSRIEASHDR